MAGKADLLSVTVSLPHYAFLVSHDKQQQHYESHTAAASQRDQ